MCSTNHFCGTVVLSSARQYMVSVFYVRFPPAATDLCRYGKPFQAGDQAIVEFLAGVGTERGLDDVQPLTKVTDSIPSRLYMNT